MTVSGMQWGHRGHECGGGQTEFDAMYVVETTEQGHMWVCICSAHRRQLINKGRIRVWYEGEERVLVCAHNMFVEKPGYTPEKEESTVESDLGKDLLEAVGGDQEKVLKVLQVFEKHRSEEQEDEKAPLIGAGVAAGMFVLAALNSISNSQRIRALISTGTIGPAEIGNYKSELMSDEKEMKDNLASIYAVMGALKGEGDEEVDDGEGDDLRPEGPDGQDQEGQG
jgi:hypothetical protein